VGLALASSLSVLVGALLREEGWMMPLSSLGDGDSSDFVIAGPGLVSSDTATSFLSASSREGIKITRAVK